MDSLFYCAYCFEPNSIFVDASGGSFQHYIEDCQVCCQPNWLTCHWQEEYEQFEVDAEPSQ